MLLTATTTLLPASISLDDRLHIADRESELLGTLFQLVRTERNMLRTLQNFGSRDGGTQRLMVKPRRAIRESVFGCSRPERDFSGIGLSVSAEQNTGCGQTQ